MRMIKNRRRLWALVLSAALVVTQLPMVSMAENSVPEDKVNFAAGEREDVLEHGSVASFDSLDRDVEEQTVDVGTELSELNLPDEVMASIYQLIEDTEILDEDDIEDDDSFIPTATISDAENGGGSARMKGNPL